VTKKHADCENLCHLTLKVSILKQVKDNNRAGTS